MRWWITDLKRGLTEPSFFLALVIGCLGMVGAVAFYIIRHEIYTATEVFKGSHALVIPFIAPLLCALPYANMNMLETDCGYKKFLLLRNKGRNYTLKRWWVNSFIGGITLLLPSLLLMVVCRSFSTYEDVKGILEVVGLNFFFGVTYSSLAYSLTFVNKKRYIPLLGPQVLYLLFIYAFPYLKLEKFFPPLTFSPWIMPDLVNLQLMIIQLSVLLGISFLIIGCGDLFRKGVTKWLQ